MHIGIKKELIIGCISIALCCTLIAYRTIQYNKLTSHLSVSPSATSIEQGTVLSVDKIAQHNNPDDCWMIVRSKVYDVTDFLSRHPGGGQLITPYCGIDGTEAFLTQGGRGGHSNEAEQLLQLIYIGEVNGAIITNPDSQSIKTIPISSEDDDD